MPSDVDGLMERRIFPLKSHFDCAMTTFMIHSLIDTYFLWASERRANWPIQFEFTFRRLFHVNLIFSSDFR